jgi:hypothetical protein
VVAAGSGYETGDEITLTGGTATTAAILDVDSTQLVSLALNAAGADYEVGDTITLAGGTSSTAAVVTVATVDSGGEVLTFTITTAGDYTAEVGSFTQDSTSGIGTGATFNTALFGVLAVSLNTAGIFTETGALSQGASNGAGTGATFDTEVFELLTVTVVNPGFYTAFPSNAVAQGSTSGSGTNGTFNMTWVTAAAAGDLLLMPNESIIIDSSGLEYVSAIRVTSDGVLQIQPLEN